MRSDRDALLEELMRLCHSHHPDAAEVERLSRELEERDAQG